MDLPKDGWVMQFKLAKTSPTPDGFIIGTEWQDFGFDTLPSGKLLIPKLHPTPDEARDAARAFKKRNPNALVRIREF